MSQYPQKRSFQWVFIPLVLLASFFHFQALAHDNRFHPDEAYFMTFARNAAVNGDWMFSGALDKPPLSIYGSALSMTLFGIQPLDNGVLDLESRLGEFTSRIPNVFAGILIVSFVIAIARRIIASKTLPLLAGIFIATSPYLISFGATAFTDILMLLFMTASLWMMSRNYWGWSGVLLILSFACKPQGIFFLPLVMGIGWANGQLTRYNLARFIIPFCIGLLLLFIWDTARPETSVFILGASNNRPESWLVPIHELGDRVLIWLTYGQHLLGNSITTILFLIVAIIGFFHQKKSKPIVALWLWILAYIAFHIFINVNSYDRYLLPLLPPLVLVCGFGIRATFTNLPRHISWIIIATILIIPAYQASLDDISVGGDKGNYDGIDQLADYLNSKPVATVIYDPWLGWELDYYMEQWTDKRRVHYPNPSALVEDALTLNEIGDRYFVTPTDEAYVSWLIALNNAGFEIVFDTEITRFRVYRLIPNRAP